MSGKQYQTLILDNPELSQALGDIYGTNNQAMEESANRFGCLIESYADQSGQGDLSLFSTPGRTEIGGNHTDHNHGRVLAASIDLDSIAVAAESSDDVVTVHSEGYPEPFIVRLDNLEPQKSEQRTTTSLIRGIAARFNQLGFKIGGFNACISSRVLPGSGLSSSASIEVLIGSVFNTLFNGGKVPEVEVAKTGQYAENEFFDKPCGLMDQVACAIGGAVAIDFENAASPEIQRVDFDFDTTESTLLVVDTGGDHVDLTDEYASVPQEMKAVADKMNCDVLREITSEQLIDRLPKLRPEVGDRAVLRALHFTYENDRVLKQVQALQNNDFGAFLRHVRDSGKSSCCWLQNCFTTLNVRQQGVMVALALTETFLNADEGGACRIHGGGFAGTILVFMPRTKLDAYIKLMEPVFGSSSVQKLRIRPAGTTCLGRIKV